MVELKLILPIYYTQTFKTKKDKTILCGMNWARNCHFQILNKVKKHYHKLVAEQVHHRKFNKVHIHYDIYVKRKGTDGGNIRSIIEKFALDGLKQAGIIVDDNINYVKSDSANYFIDSNSPRAEILIIETD